MKLIRYVSITLTLCGLLAGPALAAPLLSAHAPTLTAPLPAAPTSDRADLARRILPFGAIGAIRVKDTGTAAAKFRTRASAAAPDYVRGIEASGGDWENNTANAENTWAAATQDAIGRKAFGRGVRGSGAKYVKNAKELGAQRYPTGIANAEGAYAAGVGPYLDTIKGLTLPPRNVKGNNAERANIVAAALRARKMGS